MSIFQAVKSAIPISTILTFYGVTFKNKKAICPFHTDKHPSLTVSHSKQMFKCHACGVGGDSIQFVRKMFNLSAMNAIKRINNDFRLGIDISKPSKTQFETINTRRMEREKLKSRYRLIEEYLFLEYRKCTLKIETNPPFTDDWIEGVNGILDAEYKYDSFCEVEK